MMSRIQTLMLSLMNPYLAMKLKPLVLVMICLRVLVDIFTSRIRTLTLDLMNLCLEMELKLLV